MITTMIPLLVFIAVFAALIVYDLKKMHAKGFVRETALYCVMCAGCLVLAVLYFPEIQRKSPMSIILRLLTIKW